jgi:methionine-gamma-lyase
MTREPGFSTRAVHGETSAMDQETPSTPIFQTSTFRFSSSEEYAGTIAFERPGHTYTRGYGNPTLDAFESQMAILERTDAAMSFASGMAALHTVFTALAASGDRAVASTALYGGTYALFTKVLPRYGIGVDLVDAGDLDAVAKALPGAAFFHVETIANPTMSVAQLPALASLCREHDVPSVVDNTFASPYLVNPSTYGFDYVVHSATKYIGGHHDLIGGVVCTTDAGRTLLRDTVIETGGTLAPFEAWLCLRGLMTLSLRMERHSSNAVTLADFLRSHPKVEGVWYPGLDSHPQHDVAAAMFGGRGFGGMLAVEISGGVAGGMAFCDALEIAWIATSLGGTHTLVSHAASTTHRQYAPEARRAAGIGDGLVRISTGIEDVEDLLADVEQALEKV